MATKRKLRRSFLSNRLELRPLLAAQRTTKIRKRGAGSNITRASRPAFSVPGDQGLLGKHGVIY
jgi:hypothetical protein